MKSMKFRSTTGRIPFRAAPTPAATIAASERQACSCAPFRPDVDDLTQDDAVARAAGSRDVRRSPRQRLIAQDRPGDRLACIAGNPALVVQVHLDWGDPLP